jgi:ABC-2 type transport system permease protein
MSVTTLARSSRAEWVRIWSVRSSWILVLATAAAVIGIGALIGADAASDPAGLPDDATVWKGVTPTAMFALFGTLAMAVVTGTADHGTGAIVPTLQWTPRRGILLASRMGVVVATVTGLGTLLVAGAGLLVWALVPGVGLALDEGASFLAGLLFVYAFGSMLGVGLGLFLRSTAGALVTVIGLVLVLPPLVAQLPYDWATTLSASLPGSCVLFLIFGEGPSDDMTVTSARVTLAIWGLAALLAGGWRLVRTDANR